MTEVFVVLAVLFGIVAYAMARGAADEKWDRARYRSRLKDRFGKFSEVRYSHEQLKRIAGLYERTRDESYYVDDITWNDLNMDSIFGMMDYTRSSSGQEYLYAMLREPKLSDKDGELIRLDNHVKYMADNEDKRIDTMMVLSDLGDSGNYSIYDYMDLVRNAGKRSNGRHYFCLTFILLAFATLYVNTMLALLLIICAAAYNITSYLKDKSVSARYVSTFSYILRLMRCSDKIMKVGLGHEFDDYTSKLKSCRKKFRGFGRNSNMVLGMNASVGSLIGVLSEYVKMLTHIDLIKFNKMLKLVLDNEEEIFALAKNIGYIDAVISIAYFRAALPYSCTPLLYEGKDNVFIIRDGFHPSLSNPVANSFEQKRGMLITGSNASGKSTFLKMTAINAILAQSVHICAASQYSGGFYRIFSSMALRDNLDGGESYYIVEIKALKRIMDEAEATSPNPVLCFVDEVLRGTNTVERIAASAQILEKLSGNGVICFAATHDIELTTILSDKYDNFHFEEEVKNGDVKFPYHMHKGSSKTRNAIKLLEIIGFSDDIIDRANDMAEKFLDKGEWNA